MAEMEAHHQADDLTAERADLKEIARKLVLQINEITPVQWDKRDDKGHSIILAALKTARQEALREAASKLGIGDSSGLLDAPCLWCGYNGRGYYQVGTHDKSCIWHTVGGRNERLDRLTSEGA